MINKKSNEDSLQFTWCSIEKNKTEKLQASMKYPLKTRKFDNIFLQLCNAVYKQNSIEKGTRSWILPFLETSDLRISKNYRGITLTAIAAKVYNTLLLNRIQPEIKKILRKNENGFLRNHFIASQILTLYQIIERVQAMNLEATLLCLDFFRQFDSICRANTLLAYGLLKETVTAIMMLYKAIKAILHSPDGGSNFLDTVTGVWQSKYISTIFVYTLPGLCTLNIHKFNKRKWFYIKKAKKQMISSRNYDRCRLCRWCSTSCKYTGPSRIPTT